MIYALSPDPPGSSVDAFQERSTCPQLATLAIRAVGGEGGITSAPRRTTGENSAVRMIATLAKICDVFFFMTLHNSLSVEFGHGGYEACARGPLVLGLDARHGCVA